MSLDSLARATSSFSLPRAPVMLFVSSFLRDSTVAAVGFPKLWPVIKFYQVYAAI